MSRLLRNLLLLALIIIGGGNLSAQTKWVKTELSNLTPTDQVVIVDVHNKYAMTNDNGTRSDPAAVTVTLSTDGSELTSDVADNIKWNVISDNGKYQFHPNGDAENYLYCTNTNKGVRVGIGNSRNFVPYSKDNYVGLYNDVVNNSGSTTRRYIGVYNGSDWRTYTTVHDNIKTTSIAYYKLSSSDPTKIFTSLSFGNNADKTFYKGDKEGTTFTQTATLTPAVEGAKITYSTSNEIVAVVDGNTGKVDVITKNEGTATITAHYAGDDTHASASASYTITVDPLYSNISELKTAKSGTNAVLRLTDAKVTYVDDANHYLQDATGAIDVYNSKLDYKAGDVLNGIVSVTYTPYNGLPEVKDLSAISELKVTHGDAPAPEKMTIANAKKAENLCKYVVIKNVSVTPGSKSGNATAESGGETITVYKKDQTYDEGQYDLTGIVSIHNGTPQIAFISYAPDFTIDEAAESNAITAGENATVTIGRTFNADAWNTLFLPFDLTAEQLAEKFGPNAKFATYTGTSKNNDGTYTLNFQSVSALTANTPVFVWGANDEGVYEFSGVKVVKADPTSTPSDAAFSFTGSYDKTTLKAGDWFISSDNKFYRALGTETMKPMRAVFRPVTAAAAKGLSFSIDGGEATGISAITSDGSIVVNDNAPMYNLAGQRVSDSYKGVVIQNGKKFIK
jgi:hypothetical protein